MDTFAPASALRRFAPNATEAQILRERYGLSYHVSYCATADHQLGFAGKRILEIGGSLPREFVRECLGVASWVAIEYLGYWNTVDAVEHREGECGGHRLFQTPTIELAAATGSHLDTDYLVLNGGVEDAPSTLDNQFDAAFSIACFEHISRLPKALESIHRLLKPGGRLFTMFSPIWSAHDGHHLPAITDASGRQFGFWQSPIPPWGHLMATPSELYAYLLNHTDAAAAEEMVYYVYHAPHINRLFVEDYVRYFKHSSFAVKLCQPTFLTDMVPAAQAELERRHPGRAHFRNNGIAALLERSL